MSKTSTTSYKPWYKRISWIILIVLAALLIGANGWLLYKDSHPQSYINFTQYEPTKIVDDLKIESKTLNVWNSSLFSPITVFAPYSVDINLSLNRSGWYISESKSTIKDISLSQFECNTVGIECLLKKTANGQPYTVYLYHSPADYNQTPLVYNKLSEERLYFIQGDTSVMIRTQVNGGAPVADQDWSDMLDSFKPTTLNDLKVKHMQPGP